MNKSGEEKEDNHSTKAAPKEAAFCIKIPPFLCGAAVVFFVLRHSVTVTFLRFLGLSTLRPFASPILSASRETAVP